MVTIPASLRSFLILLVFALLTACQQKNSAEGPERPYQPWVFRSVLDEQPRILTLALNDNLWIAYHTDSCSLYKAWKGYVHLQGAVYDLHHGPQPISIGDAWLKNPFTHPWSVIHDEKEMIKEVRYAGHSLHKGKAQLMYDLILTDGQTIRVTEQPEYVEREGQKGLERAFSLPRIPDGYEVSIAQQVTSIALPQSITTNGKWTEEESSKQEMDGKQIMTINGRLTLQPKGDTYFTTYFINRPTIPNSNKVEGEEESLPLGQRLIARNDCKTCHNEKVQTIGPAYTMVAERYPWNEESVEWLTKKVIAGGSGIWGTQVMSAHPNIPESDVKEMVRYILRLDTTDVGQPQEAPEAAIQLNTTVLDDKDLLPGWIAEAWVNQPDYDNMPSFQPSKRGDQAGILTTVNGIDANAFGELTENFALVATGYLYVDKDTTIQFRLWSDDGSILTVDGQRVIDNDGKHGTEEKHTTLQLNKGFHPAKLEFFQGMGGRYLSLEWKPAGAKEWTAVPNTSLFHHIKEHSKLQGKTLSMVLRKHVPGDMAPLQSVHPSYDLSQARPNDFLPKVGGMDFLIHR